MKPAEFAKVIQFTVVFFPPVGCIEIRFYALSKRNARMYLAPVATELLLTAQNDFRKTELSNFKYKKKQFFDSLRMT